MYQFIIIFVFINILLVLCNSQGIFDFSLEDFNGNVIPLSNYKKSKLIMIVNIALNDGHTFLNFRELEELYNHHHDQGLEILAVLSNDFGVDQKILDPPYLGNIPVFNLVHVTGPSIHPLFSYLIDHTTHLPISWNFCKFLIDSSNGKPFKRYGHIINPFKIEGEITAKIGIKKIDPYDEEL